MTNSSLRRADITSCIPVMLSLRGKEIQKIIENSVRIREDVIRALFFYGYMLFVSGGAGRGHSHRRQSPSSRKKAEAIRSL